VIRAAFLSFYRSLTRHPLYSALNLLGLSFGIAVFIVLSLFVRFETSYEQWLPNADRIYVLAHRTPRMAEIGKGFYPYSSGYALDAIHSVYPGLLGTRIIPIYAIAKRGLMGTEETGQVVDDDFFKVFDLPAIAGNREAALKTVDGLILTESMARKYFGRINVVGETLSLREENFYDFRSPELTSWRVMAVLRDIPPNSNLKLNFIQGFRAYWAHGKKPYTWYWWGRSQDGQTFFLLPRGQTSSEMIPGLAKTLRNYPIPEATASLRSVPKTVQFDLRSFAGLHLSETSRHNAIYVFAWTAILVLVVALINYANLATAMAGLRAREMAMRRVRGATGLRLVGEILSEATVAGFVSLMIALSLVEISLPVFNRIGILSLRIDYSRNWIWLAGLAATVLLANLLAALYPACVFSRYKAATVLGMSRTPSGSRWHISLREGLTVMQFSIACIFFIVISGFAAQVQNMETSNLGFSRFNILTTESMPRSQVYISKTEAVLEAWRHIPGIAAVTNGEVPGRYFRTSAYEISRAEPGAHAITALISWIDQDFFKVYETSFLVGRRVKESDNVSRVEPDREALVSSEKITINVDINLSAVKALGYSSPQAAIGRDLKYGLSTLHVVGVVADQRLQGPTEVTRPTVYSVRTSYARFLDTVVRYSGIDEITTRQRLTAEWNKIIPEWPLEFTTIGQELDYYYRDDRRNTRLFAIGGGVAALIGAVGLFGMAAFNTSARVHEIGIRKAQGASRWRIMRLLMFQFLRPVLIANIIAWPIAYVVLDAWLKQFDDRVAMSPFFFLAGSGLSLLIAAATVFGVAWSGANLSPAKALRQL